MLEEFVAAGSVRQAFPSDTEKISGELVYKVAQLDDLLEGNITAINIAS